MTTAQIELPPKLIPVFAAPRGSVEFRFAYGGRGSAKTRSFALMTAVRAYQLEQEGESGVILCAREFQNSLDESSMEEVKQAILSVPWLEAFFDIGEKYIRTKTGRIRYAFSGLRHNLDSIKSKARILLCWIDEAEPVSERGYLKLIPTIREEDSELWVTWNPELDGSPTDKRFIKSPPAESIGVEMNYMDNPWFTDKLEKDRQRDLELLDPATYAHVWEGAYLENSDAQVLHGKVAVREFEPEKGWDGPYYGIDFGFANDPTAAVECWIHDDTLYIRKEAGGTEIEVSDTAPMMLKAMPDAKRYVVRGDAARPETVSAMKRTGIPRAQSAPKWQGSVEDGIQHLRSYREIVIHPDCPETIRETRMYSYKVDRHTGDILPQVRDEYNHYIDAIRYALAPAIQRRGAKLSSWL